MILFADTFFILLLSFCVSIHRCLHLYWDARWDRKNKRKEENQTTLGKKKESKAKQQNWRLEWRKFNLFPFLFLVFSFFSLYLESWNNKSRDIYTILGVGTSLQPWGMLWFVFLFRFWWLWYISRRISWFLINIWENKANEILLLNSFEIGRLQCWLFDSLIYGSFINDFHKKYLDFSTPFPPLSQNLHVKKFIVGHTDSDTSPTPP